MIRRRLLLSFAALAAAAPLHKARPEERKVFRVGLLWNSPHPKMYDDLFIGAMGALGYREGDNLRFEYGFGRPDELPALAKRIAQANADLIHCGSSAAVRAAMGATRKIPVLAVDLESDPVAKGFASSLAHPGGNLTGFFLDLPEFSAKRLEVLKETLPDLSRVTVLWDPSLEGTPLVGLKTAAKTLRLRVFVSDVRDGSALDAVFRAAVDRKTGAVMVMQSPRLDSYKDHILELGAKHRLPLMAMFANFTVDGGLLNYGPNVEDLTSRSAIYADKILKGANPGDLPIQRPTKFDLVVNLKTAKVLGITIPESILLRADEVIR